MNWYGFFSQEYSLSNVIVSCLITLKILKTQKSCTLKPCKGSTPDLKLQLWLLCNHSLPFKTQSSFTKRTLAKCLDKSLLGNFTFGFNSISHDKKASQTTYIPVKIVKENVDIIFHFLYHNFNNLLSCSTFPTGMKYADITTLHKKDNKTGKTNDCPISILPHLGKVYERFMYNQISPYFDSVFSKF